MGPTYDLVMMIGDLALILLFFWLLANLGMTILNQIYTADARMIQEYSSGYLSMSNFAPENFASNQTFPRVSHLFAASIEPPLIDVKVGVYETATISRDILGQPMDDSIFVKFIPKTPLPFTISGTTFAGSCINVIGAGGCAFSSKNYNALEIIKEGKNVALNLLFK